MRTLSSLFADLKTINNQPANRKNRRARQALSRRIMRRLVKQARLAPQPVPAKPDVEAAGDAS